MMKFGRYLISAVVAVVLLALLPSLALAGLRVTNPKLEIDVSPGEVISHVMNVGIRETDSPMDIVVEVRDLGQYSAANFITIDNPSFHLEPGDSQDVIATINVPSDVGDGGRYAIISIRQGQPTGEGAVGLVVAVNVPVRLTIKDSQLIHRGEITELTAGEAVSGQPVVIFTTFQNTGNHHFKAKAEVTISDAQGEKLDTIYISLTPPVIPSLSRQLKATFIPQGELPLGVYSVKSRLMLEDGTTLDEAEGSFEVKEPYVPPPPPVSLTITPGSAATLETEDGRISISFPRGAVISQVEISLRNYPLEQLPSPPTDFKLATTVFRVDGLTGLLAKEATVTVKYTPADLERAEGDASRLRLARWDEAENQWSVLKTKVDKEATTLSTGTNQLSIWAVMVAPPAEVNWPLIGGIGAGVIIVALLVYFLAVRRRGY